MAIAKRVNTMTVSHSDCEGVTSGMESSSRESFQKLLRRSGLVTGLLSKSEHFRATLSGRDGKPLLIDSLPESDSCWPHPCSDRSGRFWAPHCNRNWQQDVLDSDTMRNLD